MSSMGGLGPGGLRLHVLREAWSVRRSGIVIITFYSPGLAPTGRRR